MRIDTVLTYSPEEKKIRLLRIVKMVGKIGDGKGFCAKWTVNLIPRIFEFKRGWNEWRMTLLGCQIHYARSYGGSW